MPLHFPHLPHHHKDKDASGSSSPSSSTPNLTPTSPPPTKRSSLPHADVPPPQSILRQSTTRSSASSTSDPSMSSSASGYLGKRMSALQMFPRSETVDSASSDADESSLAGSTPATSVSSLDGQCPLPASSTGQRFPFFMMTLSSTSTISFIALPLAMRPAVLDAINRAWKKGIAKVGQVDYAPELMKRHKEKGCEGGVWEVTLKDSCWMPKSEDKVSSKRILINLMTEFAREGYAMTSSFRTSAKDSGKDTLTFLRGDPDPDPIFFAVAFHSSDRVWIIDAEADVGEALEKGIRMTWVDGIRDARVRERHCREIRLRGSPWTAHSTSALISARVIHLVMLKTITHYQSGYDFVGSVDMTDIEEGEMPVTFYRKKWAQSRAIWGEGIIDKLVYEPISDRAG